VNLWTGFEEKSLPREKRERKRKKEKRNEMDTTKLIEKFVSKITNSDLIFEKKDLSSRVEISEGKLKRKLPRSFRFLISNYVFVPFEVGKIYFYGNQRSVFPKELEPPIFYDECNPEKSDLSKAIFEDKFLYRTFSKKGFIQFARPLDETCDPVFFDTRRKKSNYEYPIIRLGHEELLINQKIKITDHISDSFYKFTSDFLNQ
jgi:hypothetical protein